MEDNCPLLTKLPPELRQKIYANLLAFNNPLKLRQVVPGSKDLALLRTNRQIYTEALPLLYDLNIITVTRNDFCSNTDAELKTPLKPEFVRHLLIASLSQSIACTLSSPGSRCEVCQPHAMGLIEAFKSMPRLRNVLLNSERHRAEFRTFWEWRNVHRGFELRPLYDGEVEFGVRLEGDGLEGLGVEFRSRWIE